MRTITTPERQKEIIATYLSGKTLQETADFYDMPMSTVCDVLKRNKIARRPTKKLTEPQLEEVKQRFLNGETPTSISKDYIFSVPQCQYHLKQMLGPETYKFYLDRIERRKNPINDHFIDDLESDDACYFIGWMASDGCVDKNVPVCLISFHVDDSELIPKFDRIVGTNCKNSVVGKRKKMVAYVFRSKYVKSALEKVGVCPAKSLTIGLPPNFNDINQAAYLRGLFEGDGSISWKHKYKAISLEIASGSENMLRDLTDYFTKINIKTCVCRSKVKKNSKRIRICGIRSQLMFLHLIYDNCGDNFLSRKYEKSILFIQNRQGLAIPPRSM